ncbi:hypothetical protein Ga0074812_10897 [Parafrankia irregularis]|uniref:Uncharacterized protein n=1 Tax=Parafrankia irregularis TaxID=795642 RepID=A0A0S4QMS5_9ACTN|nr:hypothetical protein Ga0074812_10897 [Parafrankia irregularis]
MTHRNLRPNVSRASMVLGNFSPNAATNPAGEYRMTCSAESMSTDDSVTVARRADLEQPLHLERTLRALGLRSAKPSHVRTGTTPSDAFALRCVKKAATASFADGRPRRHCCGRGRR